MANSEHYYTILRQFLAPVYNSLKALCRNLASARKINSQESHWPPTTGPDFQIPFPSNPFSRCFRYCNDFPERVCHPHSVGLQALASFIGLLMQSMLNCRIRKTYPFSLVIWFLGGIFSVAIKSFAYVDLPTSWDILKAAAAKL